MTIAESKKQNNIAEYIIHLYQTEDLIRAFECDIEKVREYVIKHIPKDADSKEEISIWYEEVLTKMEEQNILKNGHLNEANILVNELNELKNQLLKNDNDFKKIYKEAKPHINEMLALSEGAINNEIQICLNGIYGLLLAKINGRDVPEEIQPALDHFGNVLSYLSYKYNQEGYLSKN